MEQIADARAAFASLGDVAACFVLARAWQLQEARAANKDEEEAVRCHARGLLAASSITAQLQAPATSAVASLDNESVISAVAAGSSGSASGRATESDARDCEATLLGDSEASLDASAISRLVSGALDAAFELEREPADSAFSGESASLPSSAATLVVSFARNLQSLVAAGVAQACMQTGVDASAVTKQHVVDAVQALVHLIDGKSTTDDAYEDDFEDDAGLPSLGDVLMEAATTASDAKRRDELAERTERAAAREKRLQVERSVARREARLQEAAEEAEATEAAARAGRKRREQRLRLLAGDFQPSEEAIDKAIRANRRRDEQRQRRLREWRAQRKEAAAASGSSSTASETKEEAHAPRRRGGHQSTSQSPPPSSRRPHKASTARSDAKDGHSDEPEQHQQKQQQQKQQQQKRLAKQQAHEMRLRKWEVRRMERQKALVALRAAPYAAPVVLASDPDSSATKGHTRPAGAGEGTKGVHETAKEDSKEEEGHADEEAAVQDDQQQQQQHNDNDSKHPVAHGHHHRRKRAGDKRTRKLVPRIRKDATAEAAARTVLRETMRQQQRLLQQQEQERKRIAAAAAAAAAKEAEASSDPKQPDKSSAAATNKASRSTSPRRNHGARTRSPARAARSRSPSPRPKPRQVPVPKPKAAAGAAETEEGEGIAQTGGTTEQQQQQQQQPPAAAAAVDNAEAGNDDDGIVITVTHDGGVVPALSFGPGTGQHHHLTGARGSPRYHAARGGRPAVSDRLLLAARTYGRSSTGISSSNGAGHMAATGGSNAAGATARNGHSPRRRGNAEQSRSGVQGGASGRPQGHRGKRGGGGRRRDGNATAIAQPSASLVTSPMEGDEQGAGGVATPVGGLEMAASAADAGTAAPAESDDDYADEWA